MCVRKKARGGVSEWPRGVGIPAPRGAVGGSAQFQLSLGSTQSLRGALCGGDPSPLSHTSTQCEGPRAGCKPQGGWDGEGLTGRYEG